MGYFIKDLTYEDCQSLINKDTVIVLPIGGGSKEHGNHLPMGTDYYVTDWVATEVTKRCDVVTLPTLPYAYFPAFIKWKGSVSVDYPNFIAFVKDILMSFARFGVRKFLIIDGGVSTQPPLRLLALTLNNEYDIKVAITDVTQLAAEVEKAVCEQPRGGHGDESETSTMLYVREDLVRMDKAVEEYTKSLPGAVVNGRVKVYVPNRMCTPHGVNGNSRLATKEKGEKILFAMVDAIEAFLKEYLKWEPGDIK